MVTCQRTELLPGKKHIFSLQISPLRLSSKYTSSKEILIIETNEEAPDKTSSSERYRRIFGNKTEQTSTLSGDENHLLIGPLTTSTTWLKI